MLKFHDHAFDDDDRVVYQQSQRNDECVSTRRSVTFPGTRNPRSLSTFALTTPVKVRLGAELIARERPEQEAAPVVRRPAEGTGTRKVPTRKEPISQTVG